LHHFKIHFLDGFEWTVGRSVGHRMNSPHDPMAYL
jgi:hypothetical protein